MGNRKYKSSNRLIGISTLEIQEKPKVVIEIEIMFDILKEFLY